MLDPVAFSVGPFSIRWYDFSRLLGYEGSATQKDDSR